MATLAYFLTGPWPIFSATLAYNFNGPLAHIVISSSKEDKNLKIKCFIMFCLKNILIYYQVLYYKSKTQIKNLGEILLP